jgi:L-ascorbate metabolism protein UlaG (beta-lactamase superfamily)
MSHWKRIPSTAADIWKLAEAAHPVIAWLGQAGFIVRSGRRRILIDPYLSNSLEEKYRGAGKPHPRMMPAPITVPELSDVEWVLCTHRHTDHMDGETLSQIAILNPACRFVVPRAEMDHALALGLPSERLIAIGAGEEFDAGLAIKAVPSAHESLETNGRGDHRCLGYILRLPQVTIYHSGDTVPYEGLANHLVHEGIGIALLPVNGRGKGVAGNLTFAEAVALCREARIQEMIPHHFGMFAFNTVDAGALASETARVSDIACHIPDTRSAFEFQPPTTHTP